MKLEELEKINIPDEPGVYFFKRGVRVLYVGRATSLRSRVRSYFSFDIAEKRSVAIRNMVSEAGSLSFEKTDSVLEAVILEAKYIRKLRPKYNVQEKDDKSFNYVVFTKGDFPRVLVIRERELLAIEENKTLSGKVGKSVKIARTEGISKVFGPFPSGGLLKEAMKLIRGFFPFRDEKCELNQGRPCFSKQINLCPGTCVGEVAKGDYSKTIRNLSLFFNGKKNKLLKTLEKEMNDYAQKEKFEKAQELKKTIWGLNHINDVSLLKRTTEESVVDRGVRIEAYDIAHLAGSNSVGVMTVVLNGEVNKSDYKKFVIKTAKSGSDTGALAEIVDRRLAHPEWQMPDIFVIDGGKAQKSTIEKLLEKRGVSIPVLAVTKDESHKPKNILGDRNLIKEYEDDVLLANSESHRFALLFHSSRRRRTFRHQV